ncbi:MAG: DEAD/DEAH box helicase [Spirochaetaceae bacterium]|nr:MAG: DEAD/DEAH box helicase [Spirochaetaceae bacterium]
MKGRDFIVATVRPDDVSVLMSPLVRIRKANQGIQALVVRERPNDIARTAQLLQREFARRGPRRHPLTVAALGTADSARKEADVVSRKPDVLVSTASRIIDHLRRDTIGLDAVRTCVLEQPDEQDAAGFSADIEFIYSKFRRCPQTAVFAALGSEHVERISALLRRPVSVTVQEENQSASHASHQEKRAVSKKSFQHVRKDEALKRRIKEVVREIHEDEDPEELNAYRALINTNVSIFARGYFAAYLLKQLYANPGAAGRKTRTNTASNGRGNRNAAPAREQAASSKPDNDAPTENTTSIFVSIGKNRKVYPRDLIQLFSGVDSIDSDDIGQIKILDNYSFVELANEKTDSAIEALNNTEFRGRKLTVNYARKKD